MAFYVVPGPEITRIKKIRPTFTTKIASRVVVIKLMATSMSSAVLLELLFEMGQITRNALRQHKH